MVIQLNEEFFKIKEGDRILKYPVNSDIVKSKYKPSSLKEIAVYKIDRISIGTVSQMFHLIHESSTGKTLLNISKEKLQSGFWWSIIDDSLNVLNKEDLILSKDDIKEALNANMTNNNNLFMLNSIGKISTQIHQTILSYNDMLVENHHLVEALKSVKLYDMELCVQLNITHNPILFKPKFNLPKNVKSKGYVDLICIDEIYDFKSDEKYVSDVYIFNNKNYYRINDINFTPDRLLQFFKPILNKNKELQN